MQAAGEDLLISFENLSIEEHYEPLRELCHKYGQSHIFEHWDGLTDLERKRLLF